MVAYFYHFCRRLRWKNNLEKNYLSFTAIASKWVKLPQNWNDKKSKLSIGVNIHTTFKLLRKFQPFVWVSRVNGSNLWKKSCVCAYHSCYRQKNNQWFDGENSEMKKRQKTKAKQMDFSFFLFSFFVSLQSILF